MPRVLVTYASKHHSTAEIAEAIATELTARENDVDCVDAADAPKADDYDAVVLGSAVYMGRWRREARQFLKHNLDALSQRPFWIFSSGPTGENAEKDFAENEKWLEPRHVLDQAESAGVRGHIVFGGKIPDYPKGFIEKSIRDSTPAEFLDVRDWDQIRAWADEIADQLGATPTG